MHVAIALLCASALPSAAEGQAGMDAIIPAESLVALSDEREPHFAPPLRERSKKEIGRLEKTWRPAVHLRDVDLSPKRKATAAPPKAAPSANAGAEPDNRMFMSA